MTLYALQLENSSSVFVASFLMESFFANFFTLQGYVVIFFCVLACPAIFARDLVRSTVLDLMQVLKHKVNTALRTAICA